MAQTLGRNGVKKIVWPSPVCVQTCWCQSSQVFGRVCLCIRHECTECQACEGSLAWMLADLLNHKGSAQSTVLQVALWENQAFSRTFFVAKISEQLAWESANCFKDNSEGPTQDIDQTNACNSMTWSFPSSWPARHPHWIGALRRLQLQRSMQRSRGKRTKRTLSAWGKICTNSYGRP